MERRRAFWWVMFRGCRFVFKKWRKPVIERRRAVRCVMFRADCTSRFEPTAPCCPVGLFSLKIADVLLEIFVHNLCALMVLQVYSIVWITTGFSVWTFPGLWFRWNLFLRLCQASRHWKVLSLVLQVSSEHGQVDCMEKSYHETGCDRHSQSHTCSALSQFKQPKAFYRTRSASVRWWLQNRQSYIATKVLQWSTLISC